MMEFQGQRRAEGLRLAIVASRFNEEICDRLLAGARRALAEAGADPETVPVYRVPGAFEIPLAVQRLADTMQYDGIIAVGCVIRGETPHFDYISLQVSSGIGRVTLETGVPVTFGVLTVNTDAQAEARSGNDAENRGYGAAMAAIEMVRLLQQI